MKKLMAGPLRWLFKSAPGVALLVIAAGVGVGYAANDNGTGNTTVKAPAGGAQTAGPLGGSDAKNLSAADRRALEDFGNCMRENAPKPGDGSQPPDPAEGKAAFDKAFDTCKAKLTDSQRQQFEQRQALQEKFQTCMEQNGAPKPPVPGSSGERPARPSASDLQALRKAQKACADELPDGAAVCGPGGPGGPGGLGAAGGPGGPGGPGGMPPMGGSPPVRGGSESGSSGSQG
jgi:hypothetical protein